MIGQGSRCLNDAENEIPPQHTKLRLVLLDHENKKCRNLRSDVVNRCNGVCP